MAKKIYKTSLALLTDFYELTMAQGYYFYQKNRFAIFEVFFRKNPFNGGFNIFAGLQTLVEIILDLRFKKDDIDYLSSLGVFKKEFLDYLKKFKFTGNIYSVEEGEVVFPKEPILRVEAPIIEAQILESIILNIINFQTLIATKTARIFEASRGRAILEFGLRRAQGIDGSISGARASFIGGAVATSNTLSGKIFNIPVKGTMAHSWVMSFRKEIEAFKKYAELYPNSTILLVDTYDTKKGIRNAIEIFKILRKKGIRNFGIRLDSGDLEYLSKETRRILDKEGFKEAKIVVSNELDEYIINQLIENNSPIDFFGVGTKLITGNPDASLSGVYKIVAKKEGKKITPVIKISDNPEKITLPGIKNTTRFFSEKGEMLFDVIHLESEKIKGYVFHPDFHYKIGKIKKSFKERKILNKIVENGRLIYEFPSLKEVRDKTLNNLNVLPSKYKRLINPHIYKVGISRDLLSLKKKLLKKFK